MSELPGHQQPGLLFPSEMFIRYITMYQISLVVLTLCTGTRSNASGANPTGTRIGSQQERCSARLACRLGCASEMLPQSGLVRHRRRPSPPALSKYRNLGALKGNERRGSAF